MIGQTLGGIGLFLVGMVLVTDGLRAAAGDSLRRFLLGFTGGPIKALLSGALVTALVQSSSATTVATIGFVGAGLLTFHQALGLILGANIGTTVTGWFVATLGLEFSVGTTALPLVGIGALVRLFFRGRVAHMGVALAGFGIIFVGIDVLQTGMAGLADRLTGDELPGDTLGGRLVLVGLGIVLTTVMQSSSAAMTTALAALHGGAVSLDQAAAMVIGINIGTTVTAGLAAMGGSTAAKRTAFAHLLFNALTGVVAFATLPVFLWLMRRIGDEIAPGDATLLLAAFHTAFNVVGVILVLPFTRQFAGMVTRIIRHRGPHLTRLLDPGAAAQGALATEAVRQTTIEIAQTVVHALAPLSDGQALSPTRSEALETAASALQATEDYVATLRFSTPLSEDGHVRHLSTIHALDHIGRLIDLAMRVPATTPPIAGELRDLSARVRGVLIAVDDWTREPDHPAPVESLHDLVDDVVASRKALRQELLTSTASGTMSPSAAGAALDRLRWLDDVVHHVWRLVDHLRGDRMAPVPEQRGTNR